MGGEGRGRTRRRGQGIGQAEVSQVPNAVNWRGRNEAVAGSRTIQRYWEEGGEEEKLKGKCGEKKDFVGEENQ